MAADKLRIFGLRPRVALLSHSAFGSHSEPSASKMKRALPFSRWITDRDGNWFELEWPENPAVADKVRMRAAAPRLGSRNDRS